MPALVIALIIIFRALWTSLQDPKFRGLFLTFTILVLVGGLFYHNVEGWSLLDSVYFCVATLATVGYGDFAPTTSLGKIFTVFYIIFGIGIFIAFVNTIFADLAKRRADKGRN